MEIITGTQTFVRLVLLPAVLLATISGKNRKEQPQRRHFSAVLCPFAFYLPPRRVEAINLHSFPFRRNISYLVRGSLVALFIYSFIYF